MQIKQWLLAFFFLLHLSVYAGEIVLSGVYQGKNLYVQNPFSTDKKNFCTEEVFVNGIQKMSNIKSSAFEIDLSFLSINDAVAIRITYKDECIPKVLNAYVLRPSATFQFNSFTVNNMEASWTTTGDKAQFVYTIEQWANNNWRIVTTLPAKGDGAGIYNIPVTHQFKSNKYRVKVQDQDSHQIYYSKAVDFILSQAPVTFYPKSVDKKIILSREAIYEVHSLKGEVIKKGKGTEILLAELKTGVYYLNINDKKERFFKK